MPQDIKSNARVPWAHVNQWPQGYPPATYLAKSLILNINRSTIFLLSHIQLASNCITSLF